MFNHDATKTTTAPLELADFSAREIALLAEAVAQGATAATGMLCVATFIPEVGAFVVTPGVAVDGVLH